MPPRPPGHDFLDRNAAGRHPFASAFGHLELDLEPGATPSQALPAREPTPRKVEPFTLGGRDEAVVLFLVEPQHLAPHYWGP